MDRLFLDANVLVSASLKPDSRLAELWHLHDARLLGSPYVVTEARRNVPPPARERFESLLKAVTVLPSEPADFEIDDDPELPSKDRPVLLAAIVSNADFLLTGDMTHFGECFGGTFGGVTIMLPGEYLKGR